jgi:hypothetical protein
MTALTITAANVLWQSGTPPLPDQIAGEALASGASVYLADNGRWYKAQCDGTGIEAGANNLGMALATADVAGARISVAPPGAVVAVGTGTAGIAYVPGDTAGSLMPTADANSTDKVTLAAVGIGTNKLLLCRVYNAGAAIA